MQLTILMPCLNEAETLGHCIRQARAWIARSGLEAEILVADNGSTDGSQEIAIGLGARVVEVAERGYGAALFHGVHAARGDWIIMGDSDASYDFGDLDGFVARLAAGDDLVMGNRFRGGIAPGAMPFKNRYIGNPVLTWVGRRLFGYPIGDSQCGLRAFTKHAFLAMDLRTTGMEFASEMIIKAALFGLRVSEVPTPLAKDGRSRPPHLRPWRDGWRILRFMLLFSPRWLFLWPGSVVGGLCLVAYVRLLFGPVSVGAVTFDMRTLFLAGAGVVLGAMSVAFGIGLRMFALREGLLPGHGRLERLRRSPVLEVGGAAGLLLVMGGLGFGGYAVSQWGAAEFGALTAAALLREISVATTLMLLGGVVLLTSLVLGFNALPMRTERSLSSTEGWREVGRGERTP